MSLKFKVAGNTLVQLLGKLLTAGITLSITLLIARHYGLEGFGEFTKIITYVSLFYLAVDFGINAIFLQKDQAEFSSLLTLRVLFALVLIFLALAILAFLPAGFTPLSKLGIIVLLPTVLTQALFISANAVFQQKLRYDRSVIAASLGSLTTLLVVFLLARISAPLVLVIGGYVAGGVLTAAAALLLVRRSGIAVGLNFSSLAKSRELLQKALPLGLTLFFNLIYFRADIFILTIFRSTGEVGIYGLAYKFFEFPLALPTFFMNAVYPLLLKTNNNQQTTDNRIKKSFWVLLGTSLVVVVVGLLMAPYFSLIKEEFVLSKWPFQILILSLPLFFLSSLYMWVLVAFNRRRALLKIYGTGMIVNITLNLLLVPKFGYTAAAVITLLSEALILALLVSNYKGRSFIKAYPDKLKAESI